MQKNHKMSPELDSKSNQSSVQAGMPEEVKRRKIAVWGIGLVIAAVAAVAVVLYLHHWRPRALTIQGTVIRRDSDPRRQLPINGAVVTVADEAASATTQSGSDGYFKIALPGVVWPGRVVYLSFSHPDYQPLNLTLRVGPRLTIRELIIAAMQAVPQQISQQQTIANPQGKPSVVSNIRVRSTVNSQTEQNIGTAVRTFQVVNKGNVPCDGRPPCSVHGNWKAAIGTLSLDAGAENEFRDVRASCIAGPCPFTRIDSSRFANGGRNITISALDWSDTATFLVEAEVFRTGFSSNVHESYPVVFGRTLNFTLPPTQEGVSIEAEIDGTPMVFPLGPELYLSWATCNARNNTDPENTTVYRCELKPGYRF